MLADHVTILPADAFKDPSNQIHSSEDSNRSPPVQAPSHAPRWRPDKGKGNKENKL
jgi:hypothetical protein